MLKSNNICIVGNAISLKDSNLGRKIDNYKYVVRCNFFKTKGYEKDVGTKTTHWLITASVVTKQQIYEFIDCSELKEVWIRYNDFTPEQYKTAITETLHGVKSYRWIKPEPSSITGNWTEVFADKVPTTGLVGIVYALSRWSLPLDIAGFGSPNSTNKSHYDPSRVPSWSHHNLDIERTLINKWAEENIVRRIDEDHNSIS